MDSRVNGMIWLGSFVLLTLLVFSHLAWGTVPLPWRSWFLDGAPMESMHKLILWDVRMPRTAIAMAAGAGLSLCGLLLQTWFGNPLAGPSVLGVSSGAGMGVALVVLAGMAGGWMATTAAAVLGSGAALVLILFVANRFRGAASLLIFGLMLNYVLGALITVLQAEADQAALQQFVFWGMGTFGQGTVEAAWALGILTSGAMLGAWMMRRDLDAWTLGALTARSMGVNDRRFRWAIVMMSGLLTGGITAVCGPVAFLGLATPHLVRLLTRERRHAVLIPLTAIVGANLALLADWGVKGMLGMEHGWPLNAVLSLIGGPMVVWVLVTKTKSAV